MINSLFTLCTNIFEFGILSKYLKCFSKNRKFNKNIRFILFAFSVIVMSIVNQYQDPNKNLLFSFILIYLYSISFSFSIIYYLLIPMMYFGLCFVTEPIAILLIHSLENFISINISYGSSVLLCEMIRYLLILILCHSWKSQLPALSPIIGILFFLIPIASVIISCISIYLLRTNESKNATILSLSIILMVLLSNILSFALFHAMAILITDQHKKELLLQEAKAKEIFYREVEQSNKRIQEIKHDLKNRLLGICAMEEKKVNIHDELYKILDEIKSSDRNIFTNNIVFNTIINNKNLVAKSKHIKMNITMQIPKQLDLNYSDTGILIGNLLDNAIEACEKIDEKIRWITIDITYRESMLLLKINNSKEKKSADVYKTSKIDLFNHGFGVHSVKSVVEKYNGTIEILDHGNKFEVSALLYMNTRMN